MSEHKIKLFSERIMRNPTADQFCKMRFFEIFSFVLYIGRKIFGKSNITMFLRTALLYYGKHNNQSILYKLLNNDSFT